MSSIAVVVLPCDVAELTEEGTKAVFSATLDRSQVSVASAIDADASASQQPDQMLVNKLLFCACSVACEISTTGVERVTGRFGGLRLTPVANNPNLSRRLSRDTVVRTDDGSRILFQLPVERGSFLLAVQVPGPVYSAFGAALLGIFLQTLGGREVSPGKMFAGDSKRSTSAHGSGAGAGTESTSSSFLIPGGAFAEAIKTDAGEAQLQRRVQAVMRALLLLVSSPVSSAAMDNSATNGKLLDLLSRVALQTSVLPQSAAAALSVIHPALSDAISCLVAGETPLSCSLSPAKDDASAICRFVERGVSLWESGRLLYHTGTREALLHHSIPCALLALMSASKSRSMPLFRLAGPCSESDPTGAVDSRRKCHVASLSWGHGYLVPPDDSDPHGTGQGVPQQSSTNTNFCLVGLFGNLTVAILLTPTTTPYNGASLEAIHHGLVSFLTAADPTTLTADLGGSGGVSVNKSSDDRAPCFSIRQMVQWPYLLHDLIQDLSLPRTHPLSQCYKQLQSTFGMRAIYVSHEGSDSASWGQPALCVASPSLLSAPPQLLDWVLSKSSRRRSGPIFLSVARQARGTTEIFATFVIVGAHTGGSRGGNKKRTASALHMALEIEGCQASPAQMRALTRFVASKSW
jgi:hypothetical protein